MPVVIVNDEPVEAREDETLLEAARRNAAHIGFACGGLGICLACVCRVQGGEEHLTPPNKVERRGLPVPWLERGHRLACQTRMVGPGPVQVLSRPEELWRLTKSAIKPAEDQDRTKNWIELAKYVSDMTLQQWLVFPMSSVNAWYQAVRARPSPRVFVDVFKDTGRVIRHMSVSDESASRGEGAYPAVEEAPEPPEIDPAIAPPTMAPAPEPEKATPPVDDPAPSAPESALEPTAAAVEPEPVPPTMEPASPPTSERVEAAEPEGDEPRQDAEQRTEPAQTAPAEKSEAPKPSDSTDEPKPQQHQSKRTQKKSRSTRKKASS